MRKFGLLLLGVTALLSLGSTVYAGMHEEEDMDNKFSVHGEVRFRGESWSNLTDFTDTDSGFQDDDFDIFPYRIRLMAKGDLGHDIWVGASFQATGVAGGGINSQQNFLFGDSFEVAESGTSLYQGWVKLKDVGDSVLDLTFGRQEIEFDRGLHFSSLPFYNGISHDGIMASWDWEDFAIDAFWTRSLESNVDIGVFTFCNNNNVNVLGSVCTGDDGDQDVMGVHFKHMLGDDKDMDVAYYLFYQTQNVPGFGPGYLEKGKIYTLGGRWGKWHGEDGGWNWNIEAATQSGDYQPFALGSVVAPNFFYSGNCIADKNDPFNNLAARTCDQAGFVLEASGGYTWGGGDVDQTLWGGYTMATGDDDPNDQDQDAYIPLYTDFHKRLGYADMWALTNIQAFNIGYKVKMNDKHVFGGTIWQFTQAEEEGVSFSPTTGFAIACTSTTLNSCDDDLGQELDLFYNYYMSNNFSFDVAWSFYDPGDAIEDAITNFGTNPNFAGDDMAWRLTAQARARF